MTLSPGGAVISGIGMSPIGRRTGIAGIDLTAAAADKALSDAGLAPSDIDGITTMGDTPIREASARLGIDATWQGGGFDTGGLLSPVMSACLAVSTGRARHVLVYRTVQMMGGTILPEPGSARPGPSPGTGGAIPGMDWIGPLLTMHAYSAANWLAMHCRRHMHLYGTTKEQLGWLAVNSRRNAALNPDAAYREPLTLDDYLEARPISEPFGLYDCDVPVDGSIALVVSGSAYAGDSKNRSIRVEAYGGSPGLGAWDQRPDYPNMAATDAAADMWSRTDLGPNDVDVAELYDGFTFLSLAWLEALGLCGPGESGPFIEGGSRIALDGELPLNTYGGQLSAGRMHGYWVLHEAVHQLRHQAGEHQVAGAEVAAVSVGGGPIAGCMLLTR
ncbi:MAG: thiolase family protein [Acidimicrobiales bacterium]